MEIKIFVLRISDSTYSFVPGLKPKKKKKYISSSGIKLAHMSNKCISKGKRAKDSKRSKVR